MVDLCKQFSDDEEEADEPLAPLPDEPEVVEGDEDMDADEPAPSVALDTTHDGTETNFVNQGTSEPQTKPSSPTPVLSLQQTEAILTVDGADMLDASLDGGINVGVDVHGNINQADVGGLDMSVLGPDGTPFDALGQLDAANALLGSSLMGDTEDPFGPSMEPLSVQDQQATGSSLS